MTRVRGRDTSVARARARLEVRKDPANVSESRIRQDRPQAISSTYSGPSTTLVPQLSICTSRIHKRCERQDEERNGRAKSYEPDAAEQSPDERGNAVPNATMHTATTTPAARVSWLSRSACCWSAVWSLRKFKTIHDASARATTAKKPVSAAPNVPLQHGKSEPDVESRDAYNQHELNDVHVRSQSRIGLGARTIRPGGARQLGHLHEACHRAARPD